MKNEHKNDISIGENRWIPFVDITGCHQEAVEIDAIISDVDEIWNVLETQCVAGCCGIDAFEFWPEDIQKAKSLLNVPQMVEKLQVVEATITALEGDVLVSQRLNNYFHKQVFIQLLQHLRLHLEKGNSA